MSDTEIVLFPGKPGDEDGNGWLPNLVLDHDGKHALYVIVMDEAEGMAEHVPPEVFEAVRARLASTEALAERLLNAQAELQTALGMLRLDGVDPHIEMRLQASLAMQHSLMDDLGRPMYQPAQIPEGWTPA